MCGAASGLAARVRMDGIDRTASLEQRVASIEAQQNWLHLEQLRAEVAGLRQTVDWLIEYIAERDGGTVERIGDAANNA